MKTLPTFNYERRLWNRGLLHVAGADEVGRGCFAGPVVTAAVVFTKYSNFQLPIVNEKGEKIVINDSKKLTKLQRERAAKWIMKNAVTYGIGLGSANRINKFGIVSATNFAFRSAIKNAQVRINGSIQYLLIDAYYIPYVRGFHIPKKNNGKRIFNEDRGINQLAITKGDAKSLSISAASILAKVYRDSLMDTLSKRPLYVKYGWEKNKGYGTKIHQEAILLNGTTRFHRKMFVETFLRKVG